MRHKNSSVFLATLCFTACMCIQSFAYQKIACLGDSLTYGYRVAPEEGFVSQLQELLGNGYDVRNFGVNNASIEHGSALCYTDTPEYQDALDYDADLYIIMIGTNDAKDVNFHGKASFINDYMAMINTIGRDKVILSDIPPVNYGSDVELNEEYTTPENVVKINGLIHQISEQNNIMLLGNNILLSSDVSKNIYKDGVHLTKCGHSVIARTVSDSIINRRLS